MAIGLGWRTEENKGMRSGPQTEKSPAFKVRMRSYPTDGWLPRGRGGAERKAMRSKIGSHKLATATYKAALHYSTTAL